MNCKLLKLIEFSMRMLKWSHNLHACARLVIGSESIVAIRSPIKPNTKIITVTTDGGSLSTLLMVLTASRSADGQQFTVRIGCRARVTWT